MLDENATAATAAAAANASSSSSSSAVDAASSAAATVVSYFLANSTDWDGNDTSAEAEAEAEAEAAHSKYFLRPWPPDDPALAVCSNFVLKSDLAVSLATKCTYIEFSRKYVFYDGIFHMYQGTVHQKPVMYLPGKKKDS